MVRAFGWLLLGGDTERYQKYYLLQTVS